MLRLNRKRLAFALAFLLLLASLTALLLPATTVGSRLLLAQVPGLTVEGFDGRLLSRWRAQRLTWQAGQQQATLSNVQMTTNARCLLQLKLCIEQLKARRLDLQRSPAFMTEADDKPLALPPLHLPLLTLEFSQVQLGSLYQEADKWLSDLHLRARWQGDRLYVEQVSARQSGYLIQLSGDLQMQQDWPLSASALLNLPAPDGKDWQLALTASGALMTTLAIQGQSQGWLEAQIKGSAQPLAGHLPITLELASQQPPLLFKWPSHLQISKLQLKVGGDRQAGYRIEASAQLPVAKLSAHLQGSIFTQQANIERLQLSASDTSSLNLSGRLNWQQGLTAQLDLRGQDFPWQRLYPLKSWPLKLRQIEAHIQYGNAQYRGKFAANLNGTGTDLSLSSAFEGNFEQISLNALQLKTDAGGAQGAFSLHFAEALAWQLALTLHRLDPAFWLPELPGQLSGTLNSQGAWQNAKMQASATFDLSGKLRGQNAQLLAKGEGNQENWQLKQLDLQLGNNRLHGKASHLGEQLQADLTLALPQLKQLWPELSGSANGRIRLQGQWLKPQGSLHLAAQNLLLAEQSIGKLTVRGKFLADNGTLNLLATDIKASGQRFSRLELSASQQATQQRLHGELGGEQVQAAFALSGQYQVLEHGWQWLGNLNRLSLEAYGAHWQLHAPTKLARQADGQLNLAAHCLRSGAASLCADTLKLLPQTRLHYRLQDFELAGLAPWLPEHVALQGSLAGELSLDVSAGLDATLHLASTGGTLRVQEQGKWLDLPWQHFVLNGQIDNSAIAGKLDLQSAALGNLSAKVQLNPNLADKPVRGQWHLDGLDLALAQPFFPQTHLRGQLFASGQLRGGLLSPQIEADIELKRGEIRATDLPVELHQLEISARMRGEQIRILGGWVSGEQGRGTLDGLLFWNDGLTGTLGISGEKLPITLAPYGQLQAFPDLTLHLKQGKLAIDGNIKIPNGAIEIHSLASSVVRPSSDAVVLGREAKQNKPSNTRMNITLSVGSEQVSFNGFGLEATLVGDLVISDNLNTQGELNLRGGRYRSFGQNLKVRRARLLFTGVLQQPFIDIEAVREVGKVVAGLRVSGMTSQPQTRFFSEPSMNDEQTLSYLAFGKPLGSDSAASGDLLMKAALALGLSGSETLGERLAEGIGLSNFELASKGSGENTQVVVSGTLANRLSLSYGLGLFEPQGSIALRYQLTRRLYLEAASSLANSLDLLYRRDF